MPVFSNPAGFWALLGVPALIVIHCLQQRSRTEVVSTLFLLEKLAPESRGGRSWERWRTSRAFWLQVAAVLLATWVLAQPRWVRGESAQTVVLVLDAASSMEAFREEAVRAAEGKIASAAGRAARTEWVVLTSDPRRPPLYRGPERSAAMAALKRWKPRMGTHDYEPALRLARSLAGASGETWFITDHLSKTPPDQPVVSVGRVLANVGFAGASVTKTAEGWTWRALVKNHSDAPQRRQWWLESAGEPGAARVRGQAQTLELAAGALAELSGRIPDAAEGGVLVVEADAFQLDDRLPLVRPKPKTLAATVSLDGDEAGFFQKLLGGVEGVRVQSGGAETVASERDEKPAGVLRVTRTRMAEAASAKGAAIFLPPVRKATEAARVQDAAVVPERHPLVADLNWQGLLGSGAMGLRRGPGDEVLLWQGSEALAWLRPGSAEERQLVLNLDWAGSNAGRLPATVLLLRRFVEKVRVSQPGFYAENFEANASVSLAESDVRAEKSSERWRVEFWPVADGEKVTRELDAAELAVLRAPEEAGFFTVLRGETVLVRGAVRFADARQGDFRKAETFDSGRGPESKAAWERATRPDPFTTVWLAALGGLLLASWWPARRGGGEGGAA